jgi:hypothetical protein
MTSPGQDPLAELQDRFCIIDINGEIRMLDRSQIKQAREGAYKGEISFYKKPDGALLMHRSLEAMPIPCKPKSVIADFWISPSTVMYDQIAFTPEAVPATTLNFWTGHTIIPTPGNSMLIKEYLLTVICNNDVPSFEYLVCFMAHMLQHPEEKPGVVPVLIGGQGTGKGVFFQLLRAIWGRTTLQVSNVDGVTGQFNAALERNYVVCMDEALFAGDKRALDRLKSIVTEPIIRIEQKYQPSRTIESKHRFFAASNHEHFAHTERDDRRFFFLRVSSCRQEDVTYFRTLCDTFSDGVTLEALVHRLLNMDLSSFNVRTRPKTQEHDSQKLMSLTKFDRYWREVLTTCSIACNDLCTPTWDAAFFTSTAALKDSYTLFNRQANRHEPVQQKYISDAIKKLCPSAIGTRKMIHNRQCRGFDLPDLATARSEFEAYVGCTVQWDE